MALYVLAIPFLRAADLTGLRFSEAQDGLTVIDAARRFHAELTAAAGLDHPSEFKPEHISRRISPSEVITFADLYPSLAEGELVAGSGNPRWRRPWDMAQAHSFRAVT
mgnify:CR=1 FL=1